MSKRVSGNKLKVGDFIEVWWKSRVDMIISIVPYKGNLEYLWEKYNGGAQSARFAINRTGMTIEPQMMYTKISEEEFKENLNK